MKRLTVCAAVALLLAVQLPSGLNAQLGDAPRPGEDFGALRLHLGMLAPVSTFTDDMYGESSLDNGFAVGISGLVWPFQGRLGFGAQLIRSKTEGVAEHEFAPMAMNSPVQWLFTGDVVVRQLLDNFPGFPYVSAGVGLKQYNWAVSVYEPGSRVFAWNLAAGLELRPAALGPFGLSAEVRNVNSKFAFFGIDDGTWEPGTPAQEIYPDIGFYGGVVGGQDNRDFIFTAAISLPF